MLAIAKCRKTAGLTQAELASLLGVSRSAVGNWEAGLASPPLSRIIALAEALHISIEDLFKNE